MLIFSFVTNYNTFLFTVLYFPLLNVGAFHLQQQMQFQNYYHPYTGKLLESDDIAHFAKYRMTMFIGLIVLFIAHTWYL